MVVTSYPESSSRSACISSRKSGLSLTTVMRGLCSCIVPTLSTRAGCHVTARVMHLCTIVMAIVLVVNDDRDMLDVYGAVLEELGHRPLLRVDMDPRPEAVIAAGAEAVVIDLEAE